MRKQALRYIAGVDAPCIYVSKRQERRFERRTSVAEVAINGGTPGEEPGILDELAVTDNTIVSEKSDNDEMEARLKMEEQKGQA